MKREKYCKKLKQLLKGEQFFDVSGGCGVDLSEGKSNCMVKDGIWFRYCPFCGKEIVSKYNGKHWDWREK